MGYSRFLICAGLTLATLATVGMSQSPRGSAPKAEDRVTDADLDEACSQNKDATETILRVSKPGGKVIVIPSDCRIDRVSLIKRLPPSVVLLDLSLINGFSSTGETTKSLGIIAADSEENDTHWQISSGHHSIINLNNFGTANTTSAFERKASLLWSAGEFASGETDKRGFRGIGLLQFTKEKDSNRWIMALRSLAPWRAVAGEYELWKPGQAITGPGVYRATPNSIYVSKNGGTTGSTIPAHPSGTKYDGSVQWTYVDSADRSVFAVTEDGRILAGNGDFSATWRHKVSAADPTGTYIGQWVAAGKSKDVVFQLFPTDGSEREIAVPNLRANAEEGLTIVRNGSNGSSIVRFDNSHGMVVSQEALDGVRINNPGRSIDVSNQRLIYVSSSAKTSLDSLIGGTAGQLVTLHFLDGNTTVINMGKGSIRLQGNANLTPATDSVIHLRKVPASIGDRWVEDGRSLK